MRIEPLITGYAQYTVVYMAVSRRLLLKEAHRVG